MRGDSDDTDEHVRAAWRSWLSALATDANAALAAAVAYESLSPEARRAWLDALDDDAAFVRVPAIALYAPLLAVESDADLRRRIEAAIAEQPAPECRDSIVTVALRGVALDGTHACIVVAPVYLDFVQVLSCRYTPTGGFMTVRHDPLRHSHDVTPSRDVDGVVVEPTPLGIVIEELAHAILADRREQRLTPPALASFAHLFAAHVDDGQDADPSRP